MRLRQRGTLLKPLSLSLLQLFISSTNILVVTKSLITSAVTLSSNYTTIVMIGAYQIIETVRTVLELYTQRLGCHLIIARLISFTKIKIKRPC